MVISTYLAKALGKSAQFILQKGFKRGSHFPGNLALKIDPKLLQSLSQDYQVIVVTGTNGKTLTTALITSILRAAYGEVLTNPTGANMKAGITAAFLAAKPTKNGKKIAVLEIDEAYIASIIQDIRPDLFVFTNIFRDQMDRFGEIYTTLEMILKGPQEVPSATVILNGDSPLFNKLELANPIKYFGFNHDHHEPRRTHYNTEGVLCPDCHHILDYKLNTYANLGDYICAHCGFTRPPLDYQVTQLSDLSVSTSSFTIDGQDYQIQVGGLYNIYNALAAISVAEHLGIEPTVIKAGFDQAKAIFGRQETFQIEDKSVTLILVKNPVGANQVFDLLKLADHTFNLGFLLNANYADGIDTSWIWDANFEVIADLPIDQVYTGGVRYHEMSRRVRVAGIAPDHIHDQPDIAALITDIAKSDQAHTYVLATYTAMLEMRDVLTKQDLVKKDLY